MCAYLAHFHGRFTNGPPLVYSLLVLICGVCMRTPIYIEVRKQDIQWIYIYIYIDRLCVLPTGFDPEFFLLKFNSLTFEYKINSVEVDLYYTSIYKPKIK